MANRIELPRMDEQGTYREGGKGMSDSPKRPRIQFSLKWFFICISLIAIWLGWNAYRVREREVVGQFITSHGGQLFAGTPKRPWKQLPLTWRLLGAQAVADVIAHGNYHRRRRPSAHQSLISRSRNRI